MRKNFNFSDKKIISDYYNLAKTELSQINRSITGKGTLKLLNIIPDCDSHCISEGVATFVTKPDASFVGIYEVFEYIAIDSCD